MSKVESFKRKKGFCGEQPVIPSQDSDNAPLVGPLNETCVRIEGRDTLGLIDTGSQVSCVSETFFNTHLKHLQIFPLASILQVEGIDGSYLPYTGYIEAEITFPGHVLGNVKTMTCLLLVTKDTNYNKHCPVLLGTNVILACLELNKGYSGNIPRAWRVAFQSVVKNVKASALVESPVQVLECTGVPAHSSVVVVGSVGCQVEDTSPVLIESAPESTVPGGLLVTPAIYSCSEIKEEIPIHVVNTSDKDVVIPANCVLCCATSVKLASFTENNLVPSRKIREAFPLESLTMEQRDLVYQCLERHVAAFSWSDWDLGHCDKAPPHKIFLKEDKPFRERYRRIPPQMVEEVRAHLQQMLEAGVIQESTSPYSSPAVFVRKPNGSLRFVVDYRKLNKITIRDSHYLPRIDETFDRLAGSSWFSTLDLKAGYWQLDVDPEDRQYTAFTAGCLGFYEYLRLPMGLTNSAPTFQRVMESVMGPLNLQACLLYLDDIIIYSDSFQSQVSRLDAVLTKLEEAGLKLKPDKCCLFKREIKYLGHILSADGIRTDPDKITKVKSWPVPQNRKQLHRFLAFCGYYRRFIKNFSKLAFPLQKLLRGVPLNKVQNPTKSKSKGPKLIYPPFEWDNDTQLAFDNLLVAMTSAPVLAYANFSEPFFLQVDASSQGLGAVLSQRVEGVMHPIAFASRGLTPTEARYPAHKLEFLALKWAITDKFFDYLYSSEFEVETDSNPLLYVMTSAKLDATGLRWVAALSSFNFSIRYRPGKLNSVADALSRMEENTLRMDPATVKAVFDGTNTKELVSAVTMSVAVVPDCIEVGKSFSAKDWSELQCQDTVIEEVRQALLNQTQLKSGNREAHLLWLQRKKLVMENGVLYRVCDVGGRSLQQLVLPSVSRLDAMKMLHDDMGHLGRERLLELLKSRFYWPKMNDDVVKYLAQCESCLKRKKLDPRAELVNITSTCPMELLSMDFLGLETSTGGYNNILVLTDNFTKYAMAIPTRNQTAKTTAKALIDLFVNHYGLPKRLHSDQGPNFTSKVIKEMCAMLGIEQSMTTPYHAMANGQCERFNRTLLDMLGTLPEEKKSRWKEYVQPLVHAYNCTKSEVTGYSPFELMFGRRPRLPIDHHFGLEGQEEEVPYNEYITNLKTKLEESYKLASSRMLKAHKSSKDRYDKTIRGNLLSSGDRVLIKKTTFKEGKHKLANRWEDKVYIVERQISDLPVYVLHPEEGKGKKKHLHRNNLLPIGQRNDELQDDTDSSSGEEILHLQVTDNSLPSTVATEQEQVPVQNPSGSSPQKPLPAPVTATPESTSVQPQATPESTSVQPVSETESEERQSPSPLREEEEQDEVEEEDVPQVPQLRRSKRTKKLPVRFQSGDYILGKSGSAISSQDKISLVAKMLEFLN